MIRLRYENQIISLYKNGVVKIRIRPEPKIKDFREREYHNGAIPKDHWVIYWIAIALVFVFIGYLIGSV